MGLWRYSSFISLLFFGNIEFGQSATFSSVTSLYNFITKNSYRYIRPETDLNNPTTLHIKFYLVNLQDLDDNTGLFSVVGFFEVNWYDRNRVWDPSLYGGTEEIVIPTTETWTPYLFLGNPYKEPKILSLEGSTIRVYPNGESYWYPSDNYEMACDADVSFFPFDSQTCKMMILPWQQPVTEIVLNLTSSTVLLTYYNQNPTWSYVSSNLYIDTTINALYISMTFKRIPTFFMINMIFPIILLGFLNIFVFMLPADSGQRVGFGITLLLAISVFLTIVADALPSTSSPRLSSVGIFLCISFIISSLMMVCIIIGLVIHHRDEDTHVTQFWKKFMKLSKICKKQNSNKNSQNKGSEYDIEKEKRDISWKDVSKFLDTFFIVIFTTITIVANFAFFLDIVVGVNK